MSEGVRIGIGLALSALSGVLLLLAFPPYGVWPLMWVGFIPLVLAQYRLMPRRWSSLAGLVFFWVFMEVKKKRHRQVQERVDATS